MSLTLHQPDTDDDDPGADAPLPRHYDDDDAPEPYISEPTPAESDALARAWWAGRLG